MNILPLALLAIVAISGCTAPGLTVAPAVQEAPALTGDAAAQADALLAQETEQAAQNVTDQDIENALLLSQ